MNEEQEVANSDNTLETHTNIEALPKVTEQDIQNEILQKSVVQEEEVEQSFDVSSLKNMSLEDILTEAESILVLTPKAAATKLKAIKTLFYDKYNSQKDKAKEEYETSKTEESPEFYFEKSPLIENLNEIESKVKQAKKEEKERIELEKKNNLAKKEDLLKQLEEIVAKDETLETINQVKEIQKEWKTIRVIPKEAVSGLWDRYNILQNKFYDNHSINIELKELDRQKNLSAKIDLTKKVELLLEEKSLKRSFILLNKYHEEFKNIGPVPTESREPLWLAFKSATDAVYEAKRKVYEELEAGKEINLKKKEILAEKAELINEVKPESIKDWNEKTKVFEDLFSDWKKIGPVPKSNKDAVWEKFNGVRNDFYSERKEYFKVLNAGRNENLKAKERLCEKVETLKDSTEWNDTSKKIIALQGEWKSIGPVPEKVNQAIWKRFRNACDSFFNAKNVAFSGKREEETANLVKKEALIKSLKELGTKEIDNKEAFAELKKINAEWRATGYVPHRAVKKISSAYEEANNAVYQKYSAQIEAAKSANLSDHYKELKQSHNGEQALDSEERNIKRRIGTLREEVASIERNMSFFSMSKTAEKMLKDFEVKIDKANGQISTLKKELVAIKNARKTQEMKDEEPAASEENTAASE